VLHIFSRNDLFPSTSEKITLSCIYWGAAWLYHSALCFMVDYYVPETLLNKKIQLLLMSGCPHCLLLAQVCELDTHCALFSFRLMELEALQLIGTQGNAYFQ